MSSDIVKQLRARVSMTERLTGHKGDGLTLEKAADRIEALEGEVARLNKAHNERLKQNTLERAATHKQFHRAEAAEARAERLRAVLQTIHDITNDPPVFERARKALEDKQ
jgi:hypothetical protein